jgi:hypothetical protein
MKTGTIPEFIGAGIAATLMKAIEVGYIVFIVVIVLRVMGVEI